MPYVTEAIWEHLPDRESMLVVAQWPKSASTDPVAEAEIDLAIGLTRSIRNVRAEYKVDVGRRIAATIVAGALAPSVERARPIVEQLARTFRLDIAGSLDNPPRQAIHLLIGGIEAYVPLAGMIDLDAERSRISGELMKANGQLEVLDRRLEDQTFLGRAPAAVVDKERERRATLAEQVKKLTERQIDLNS